MKRSIAGCFFVAVVLLSAGCHKREQAEISVDGFLAVEHPDSARRLLQRIDPERLSRDERAAAWYTYYGPSSGTATATAECSRSNRSSRG